MKTGFLHSRWPGVIAAALLIFTSTAWVLWGTLEMFFEGWGQPFPRPLAYLVPGAACLLFTLLALRWPRCGGWLLILGGLGFTAWWWTLAAGRGWLSPRWVAGTFPVSGMLAVTGALFLLEARYRRERAALGAPPPASWRRRNARYLAGLGIPLLVFAGISAYSLPRVLHRLDDGYRGARLIRGEGVTLIWAPEGPGWNWKQPWGGYPSWNSLALYGAPPLGLKTAAELGAGVYASEADMQSTGLCAYLSADGLRLLDTPRYIWRMPTAEEIARSLTRRSQNAACLPAPSPENPAQYRTGRMDCALPPDKETPLWAPDREPVYYWAAEACNGREAYYVSYSGRLECQDKSWGNPRHGYRCVKEP